MAYTKDELLTVLNNISGPVPASVLRDIIESVIAYAESLAIGGLHETQFLAADGDIVTGDLEFTDNAEGVILLDRVSAKRYRLLMSGDTFSQEEVT